MASELNVLAHMLDRIGESNRRSRDFTLDSLRDVITEVVACFPVYRTYVDEHGWRAEDRAVIARAIARARRRNPAMESSLFDFFREVVLPRDVADDTIRRPAPSGAAAIRRRTPRKRARALRFAMKLQQYTGPVQAKGLEDTAFYRYNVLLSLNEVGGDPSRFGRSVEEFHEANAARGRGLAVRDARHRHARHEARRGRAGAHQRALGDARRLGPRGRRAGCGSIGPIARSSTASRRPTGIDEYRFYQTLVGRLAARSARRHRRSAVRSDPASLGVHDQGREGSQGPHELADDEPAVRGCDRALREQHARAGRPGNGSLAAFLPFQRRVAALGMINSLAQVTLKLGSPGVPDFYQGTDLWDLSLVDPDNRRPVDFAHRARLLDEVDAPPRAGSSVQG